MRNPFDSISQRVYPESPSSPSSVHSGISINILSAGEGVSPIETIPGELPVSAQAPSSAIPLKVPARFGATVIPLPESPSSTVENTSLNVLPRFEASQIPLPESHSSIEQGVFTRGRYASLPLNVTDPFSETPVVTPDSSNIQ